MSKPSLNTDECLVIFALGVRPPSVCITTMMNYDLSCDFQPGCVGWNDFADMMKIPARQREGLVIHMVVRVPVGQGGALTGNLSDLKFYTGDGDEMQPRNVMPMH